MNFSINPASDNKKYFISPQKRAEQTPMPKKDISETQMQQSVSIGTNKILAGLGGLAVIGLSVVLIGRSKKKPKTKLINKTDDIPAVKNKIKTAYLAKKSKIVEDCKSNVVNEKEIQKYIDIKNEVSTNIKSTLKNLQSDSEWLELRKIRKSLLKTLNADEKSNQHNVASKKIELVNNILICKLYPQEEQAFKDTTLMDISDALDIIKTPFNSLEEFNNAFYAKQKYDFDFAENEKFFYKECNLTLRDLFPDDMKRYDYANNKIKELYLEPKAKLHEKLVELAKEFQTSEDVKNLKYLNNTETQTAPIIA